jgi:hypothetical protein
MEAAGEVQTRAVPVGSKSIAKVITKVITRQALKTRARGRGSRLEPVRASGGIP